MDKKIKVGIVGYGNLGRGVESAITQTGDLELEAIFTRRNVNDINTKSKVDNVKNIENYKDIIDIMILCGGSANDLGKQAPEVSKTFNIVDAFDNHSKIPEYFEMLNKIAKDNNTLSLIATGWDPGLFSLNRVLFESILPEGVSYTFWGKGVSQGHSDAIRKIEGVKLGVQYTIPNTDAISKIRQGTNPDLSLKERHKRLCYVVADENADQDQIENNIKTMPDYFEPYDTSVEFISEDDFKRNHQGMPHGGFVIRTGSSANNNNQRMEFILDLKSNPEFTASVLVAYARAIYKISKEGKTGTLTVFDIPFGYLSEKSPEQLRKDYL